ncbi:MAG TPA: sulfotransferase, partial [Acidimicrobiia bacterium]|nr:sulfotransferase [Acidimicrobiia bacterium]
VDIQYETFVADPIATIRDLYARWGVELAPDVERRMRAFLADHGQHQHGVHRYAFADTGQSADRIRERARRYTGYFQVPEEPLA